MRNLDIKSTKKIFIESEFNELNIKLRNIILL